LKPCNLKCDALNKSWSLKSTQVFLLRSGVGDKTDIIR
jgi:hypothetical protein